MKAHQWIILVTATLFLIIGSCLTSVMISGIATQKTLAKSPGQCYGIVTAEELMDMLKNKDFILVNVHVPYQGELPQTDVFIPYDEIDRYLDRLPVDKNAKIMLYCRTDRMSRIAADRLVELGYTNVWEMKGGMQEWRKKGYPILNATF